MKLKRFIVQCTVAAALAGACALAPAPLLAHNFHAGITDISYNERSGSTEVVHTYMAHDVEALLTNLYQRQFDLSDPEDQAVFRKVVEKQFWLADKDKRRLPLNWVGMTADAQSVTVVNAAARAIVVQRTAGTFRDTTKRHGARMPAWRATPTSPRSTKPAS